MPTTPDQILAAAIQDSLSSLGVAATWKGSVITVHYARMALVMQGAEIDRPVIKCLSTDITGMAHGDTITIGATTYYVIGFPSDPRGSTYSTLVALSEDPDA